MPDLLDTTKEQLRSRLDELRPLVEEYKRLESALEALDGVTASNSATPRRGRGRGPGRSASAARTSSTGRRRGRPPGSGGRAQQFLEVVRSQPGITIPQAAKKMGIQQNYLYRVGPRLAQEGQVRKQGKGYFPAENGSTADAGSQTKPAASSSAAGDPNAA